MSRDRTRTRSRERAGKSSTADFELDLDAEAGSDAETPPPSGSLRTRTKQRAEKLFSPRAFIAALLLSAGGLFAANTLVPLPGSGLLGVFLATFIFGLVANESRYAETAVAGGSVVATSLLFDFLVVSVLGGLGAPLVAIGAVLGAVVAVLGTYFGRDLRDGLTREI